MGEGLEIGAKCVHNAVFTMCILWYLVLIPNVMKVSFSYMLVGFSTAESRRKAARVTRAHVYHCCSSIMYQRVLYSRVGGDKHEMAFRSGSRFCGMADWGTKSQLGDLVVDL